MITKLTLKQQLGRHSGNRGRDLALKEVTPKGNVCRLSDLDRLQQRTNMSDSSQLNVLYRFTDQIRACSVTTNFTDLTTDRCVVDLHNKQYEIGSALFIPMKMIILATTFGSQNQIFNDGDTVRGRQKGIHLQVEINSLRAVIRAYQSFFGVKVKLPDNVLMQSLGKLDQSKYLGREIFTVDPTGIYVFVYGQKPKLITETGSYAGPQVWADLVIARVIEPVAKQVKMAL